MGGYQQIEKAPRVCMAGNLYLAVESRKMKVEVVEGFSNTSGLH